MTDERITINDIRACGFCVWGAKEWFTLHGLDPKLVLGQNAPGIPVADFLATGDEMARQVVERKRNG